GRWQKSLIFDGGIVGCLLLTIPQSFCFAKIQPPLHKGAFFCPYGYNAYTVSLFLSINFSFLNTRLLRLKQKISPLFRQGDIFIAFSRIISAKRERRTK
ncbi:MAG: hypothetical protein J6R45_04470, partial [Clostridia bacterium]|nr:hypothetical protein [Clostridia bacterium]